MLVLADSILYLALPYAFLILGLVLTVRYLKILDLTFASSFVLGPAIMARMLVSGMPFGIGLVVALLATACLSAFSIVLMRHLRMDVLLAGLLSSFAGFALALLFSEGTISLSGVWTPFTALKERDALFNLGHVPLHPFQLGVMTLLVGIAYFFVDRYLQSEHGLAFRAMEDERSAPALLPLLGVSPARLRDGGMLVGNTLCMMSGLVVAMRENQVTAQRGFDALLTGMAAYLLGIGLFSTRPRTTAALNWTRPLRALQRLRASGAALAGLVVYFTIIDGISRFDVPASVPRLIVVALIVAAIVLGQLPDLVRSAQARRDDHTVLCESDASFSVSDAHVSYPGYPEPNTVLDGAMLTVHPGELLHLVADNGVGKSTLLHYAAGIVEGSGVVRVPVATNAASRSKGRTAIVGLVSQDASRSTCSTLTVDEHRMLYLVAGSARRVRPWHARRTALPDYTNESVPPGFVLVGHLSGGQRQQIGLSAFVLRDGAPKVVLLDEPLAHLDEANAHRCVDVIEQLVRDGRRVVLVQHDLNGGDTVDGSARGRLARLVSRRVVLDARPPRTLVAPR